MYLQSNHPLLSGAAGNSCMMTFVPASGARALAHINKESVAQFEYKDMPYICGAPILGPIQ